MIIPFTQGAQPQNSESHEEPPTSHVGRPHSSHPFRLHLTRTVGDSTGNLVLAATELVRHSSDALPERVRPKDEPTEESDSEPTGKARRKGPRRRGR